MALASDVITQLKRKIRYLKLALLLSSVVNAALSATVLVMAILK